MGNTDVSDIANLANGLKQFSIDMMKFNIEMASIGVYLDSISKITNNFMSKPDKINSTQ